MLGVERLTVSGAVLRLAEALPAGRWVVADLQVGSGLSTPAKVAWSQPVAPGLPLTLAGLEFVGTWEALGALRRAILEVVGSRALDGDAAVGFVVAEPGGGWTCYGAESMTLAVVTPDGARFGVRRRDPREAVSAAASFDEALARAFDRTAAPRLDPPLGPPGAARAASRPPAAAPAPSDEGDGEAAVLAARTMVLGPGRPPPSLDDDADEEQVLAARTMIVDDRPPLDDDDEDEVLGAHTLVLRDGDQAGPQGRTDRRWSKVLDGGRLVGWIAPDTASAWSIYDEQGRKTAVVAADEGRARVCWLGDKATESFEYFEAPTPREAIAVAYELTGPPAIEPPIAGL